MGAPSFHGRILKGSIRLGGCKDALWGEMKSILSICLDQIDRLMCNTNSGSEFFEDVVQFCRTDDLPPVIREKLFYRNAAQFFTIP